MSEADDDLQHLSKILTDSNSVNRDRTVAIICTAYIEKHLADHLVQFFPGLDVKSRKKLFEHPGILSTLVAKIDIAQALGAADSVGAKNMKTIARIRNIFAHNLRVASFDVPQIAPLVDKLTHLWDSALDNLLGPESRAQKFEQLALHLCLSLETAQRARTMTV